MDPKVGFWLTFHTLKLGIFQVGKDMGSKSYLNPVFIVGKKYTVISYCLLVLKNIPFFVIFAVFDTLNMACVVRASP